ncbi:MAG TPA: TA system VapC family ribonuclease toxin [Xanthobacteraceae bacterium]|nr:TA system VapC family ribonuclease toxin [Xanthobacteraceae bacterium]
MLVVDTNVLVYAVNSTDRFHKPCRDWIERQRQRPDAWYVTWPIIYEFLRVSTHPRILPRPWSVVEAWEFVVALFASPGLGVLIPTPRHADIASELFAELPYLAGNILHDAHTAILMREHGIRQICTRDTDFTRFPFLDVIDPLAG